MRRAVAFWTLLALGLALAQGGPPNLSPEMRQRFEAYRPVFDLVTTIGLMEELDKQRGLAFTKAQAQRLLPILRDLQNRPDLKPAEAARILGTIEDAILTPAQLKWMDETILKRREEARQRQGQGAQAGGPQAPGGRGGLFQAIAQGKPYNPFKEQPRAAENLKNLISLLSKR
ncbi:MAG: hypothetical protein NZ849_03905 [Meiothermus sp.]|uniref:hypothetical protein n=1 Tax=Meiothermus sp. TaxID=1955249 RepID=UPI0025F82193|nr:hypothetical protein [Meiothermus sp.]MCS7058078.1 hypothetical protein [Meiothermus sp.]MCS7194043.1 hypothetical protein [Meiothermus sp.]MCX7740297.1 hypothetical protein [Meiothermus sp.]MDW8091181.1 hypothetical protein [Meiothermus sp.]MDW8480442.1 hypothetical protein [Meiothermus sp.]